MRRRWSIENKQLVPTRWANVCVGRRCNRARSPGARDGREDRPLAHTVTMCAGLRTHQRNSNSGDWALSQRHADYDGGAICPILVRDRKTRLGQA